MKALFSQILVVLLLSLPPCGKAQFNQTWNNQVFSLDTSSPRMSFPWSIVYGPDDSLWITEARNYLITKMHPGNYGRRTLINLSSMRNFANGSSNWPQGGMMGMALHPNFTSGKPYLYVALVYFRYGNTGTPNNSTCSGTTGSHACYYKTKILRYTYDFSSHSLGSSEIVLDDIPGSNDHNSGRMKIGPDLKLYYTVGDMGAGQFNNLNRTHNSQNPNVYEGKVLRLNTEPDGDAADPSDPFNEWIPNDNPFNHSVSGDKLATYTYGHRNAQGLSWGNVNGVDRLYSCEHGDKSDDEVNIIQAGRNYGWPKVVGGCDNNYNSFDGYSTNDALANQTVGREDTFCTSNNVKQPMFGLLTATAAQINSQTGNIYTWRTVAPSSVVFYGSNYIPGWRNSLLVTSLKYGMYRLKLNANGDAVDSSSTPQLIDTLPYFHGFRIRDVAIAPTGDTMFFIIDSTGSTSGPTGGFNGANTSTTAGGRVLRVVYVSTLALNDYTPTRPVANRAFVRVFPNPTNRTLFVESKRGLSKPLRIQLYDQIGRRVFDETTSKDNFSLDLTHFMNGMYVFKLFSGHDILVTTEKIIKY